MPCAREFINTFLKLKNNQQAVGVYGFRSKFYGVYYDYQNTKTRLKWQQPALLHLGYW